MCKQKLLGLLFLLIAGQLLAQKTRQRKLQKTLKQITAFNQAQVGVQLIALETQKPLANWQANRYFTPASNTKLLTALAAAQTFDTLPLLFYQKDSLQTLHFQATGYPLFKHPFHSDRQLDSFLQEQEELCYHISDESPLNRLGPGWSWDDAAYYFSAVPSVFPVHGNVIQMYPDPVAQSITVTPLLGSLTSNTSQTAAVTRDFDRNVFSVNPYKFEPTDTLYTPFVPSEARSVQLMEKLLQKAIKTDTIPLSNPQVLKAVKEEERLYKAVLQNSDNLISENLLLMVGHERFGYFSSAATLALMKQEWEAAPDPWVWVDGSGLSRYNLVTPRNLIWVLQQLYSEWGPDKIIRFFPQAGVSGTIKRSYSSSQLPRIFAKTGTLRNNHNLSGFIVDKKDNWYAFSIMVNQHTTSTEAVRQGIRKLLEVLTYRLK